MWNVSKVANEGLRVEGSVLDIGDAKDSATVQHVAGSQVRFRYRLTVAVRFEDGDSAEFEDDVPDHFDWHPRPDHVYREFDPNLNLMVTPREPRVDSSTSVPAAQPISLAFRVGDRIPVRHDPRRRKFVVDLPALRLQVVQPWLDAQKER